MRPDLHIPAIALLAISLAAQSAAAGELGELLRAALEHPSIQAADTQAAAARAEEEAATGRYLGSMSLSYGWHHYESPRVVGIYVPGGPTALLSDRVAQSVAAYSVPVDLFGVLSAGREKAHQDLAAAHLQARQASLLKLHQTASAYYALQALDAQRDALATYRKAVDEADRRTRAEVALGRAAAVDARYADSETARLAADEKTLAGTIRRYQAEIEEATGNPAFRPHAAIPLIPPWRESAAADALPAQLATARRAAAKAQAEEERRALLPALSLDANYVHNAAIGGDYRKTWALGGTVTIPLDARQYRQAQSHERAFEAADRQAEAAARDSGRQAAELRIAYDSALADAAAMEKEAAYQEEIVLVEREMQKLGSQTLENLFRHERDLLDARYRLAQARADAAIAWSAAQGLAGADPETYISEIEKP